jgi:hypothetical protein
MNYRRWNYNCAFYYYYLQHLQHIQKVMLDLNS